jgi:hypothetical protein
MATSKQIAANRRNAQESTGPKTAEGLEIVSRNALTHGLTAARAVVLPEEQEEFDRFAAALRDEWDPQSPLEHLYLDRMIQCAWRLKRTTPIETGVLLALVQQVAVTPVQNDPATLGRAYIKGNVVFASLSRHERHIERSLREAQHELELAKYTAVAQVSQFYARNLKKFPAPGTVPRRATSSGRTGNRDATEG